MTGFAGGKIGFQAAGLSGSHCTAVSDRIWLPVPMIESAAEWSIPADWFTVTLFSALLDVFIDGAYVSQRRPLPRLEHALRGVVSIDSQLGVVQRGRDADNKSRTDLPKFQVGGVSMLKLFLLLSCLQLRSLAHTTLSNKRSSCAWLWFVAVFD